MKLEATSDPCAKLIVDYDRKPGERMRGFALQMSDGRWGAFDPYDKPLVKYTFPTAKAVLKWFRDSR